jgi:hypothetical protein
MASADVDQDHTDAPEPQDSSDVPGWRLWQSDGGSYYATRKPRRLCLTHEQLLAGFEMTLAADSPDALARLIDAQPKLPED